jgi:hypothetical protein
MLTVKSLAAQSSIDKVFSSSDEQFEMFRNLKSAAWTAANKAQKVNKPRFMSETFNS